MKDPEMTSGQATQASADTGPWWRHGMMWLVVGGPAAVVVAAVITAVIAIRGADIVVDETGAERGAVPKGSYAPAVTARNHAATPTAP
jgi:hypothetical protein